MGKDDSGEEHQDDDDEQGQGGSDDQGGGGGDDHGGGVRLSAEEMDTIVQRVVAALRGGPAGGDGAGDGGGDGDKPAGGGRLIDEERRMEQIVRDELAKVRSQEDVESLKEQVKKIVERPPKRYRKVTQLMWGRGDDE